jgi:carbon-monoxide dehydrogenase medium subunit
VAPTPLRAKRAEEVIKGKKIEDGIVENVAQVAFEEAQPISDVRSSGEYRREMVRVLTKQAIMQSLVQAKQA